MGYLGAYKHAYVAWFYITSKIITHTYTVYIRNIQYIIHIHGISPNIGHLCLGLCVCVQCCIRQHEVSAGALGAQNYCLTDLLLNTQTGLRRTALPAVPTSFTEWQGYTACVCVCVCSVSAEPVEAWALIPRSWTSQTRSQSSGAEKHTEDQFSLYIVRHSQAVHCIALNK